MLLRRHIERVDDLGSGRIHMLYEPVTWHSILRDFGASCAAATPGGQADRLREGSALFQFIHSARPEQVPPEIERMITSRQYETAAIALIQPNADFYWTDGTDGMAYASVQLPGFEDPTTAHARTVALALLAAYSLALLRQHGTGSTRATSIPRADGAPKELLTRQAGTFRRGGLQRMPFLSQPLNCLDLKVPAQCSQ